MAGPSAGRIIEWEGGSLSELVAILQAAALPVRIEVIAPGTTGSNAGEVHLLAGGLADAFAGSLRRDDALAALQRMEGARFLVESRLPDPVSGSLGEAGPHAGSLKDRPVAALMRYCEDYVLTCRVEVWRGQDRAVISYRRGEIIGTIVGGSEGSERLPEVLAWSDGEYEIILPAPVLPQMPARGRERTGAVAERKRRSTLPMIPPSEARTEAPGNPRTGAGAQGPATEAAAASPPRPGVAPPTQPAGPLGVLRVSPPSAVPPPAAQKLLPQPVAVRPPAGQQAALMQPGLPAHGTAARPSSLAVAGPKPIATVVAAPLQPEMTARGTPPVPDVPLVPAPAARPEPRPTIQGVGSSIQPKPVVPPKPAAPLAQAAPKPVAPAQPKLAAPLAQPGPKPVAPAQPKPAAPLAQPGPKPVAPAQPKLAVPLAQPGPKPVAPAQPKPAAPLAQAGPKPVAPAQPKLAAPLAQPGPKPVAPAQPKSAAPMTQPEAHAQPKPAATPLTQPAPMPAHPVLPRPAAPPETAVAPATASTSGQPPVQLLHQAEKLKAANARPTLPSSSPAASNDLLPASGTIEAKPKHANHLPPAAAPVQIAQEPRGTSAGLPSTQAAVPSRPPRPRHARVVARKRIGEHPVRDYVFLGLAIGLGIVLAYWAYGYLPFGHR